MSGDRREWRSPEGSIFLAAAWASALSRMADSAVRLISKTGREALDIENDMVRILGLVDWVRAIASEPNMHPIGGRFNLNAVDHVETRNVLDETTVRLGIEDGEKAWGWR